MKDLLKTVIYDQRELFWEKDYVDREIFDSMPRNNEIIVISGVRRSGKSTLLHQIRQKQPEKDYFLNFDDERLIKFTVEHFQELYETFIELFGVQKTFYFDEIQNIKGWERFVRRLYDHGNKVFITGSNASMLSRELGTHLTGRFIGMELYPFSFTEFVKFKENGEIDKWSSKGKSELQAFFQDYLFNGGFPLYIKNRNEEYLKSLYDSILYRDVMVRHRLTNEKELLELVHFLASNVAKRSSYNSLAKVIQVRNASTIKNYLGFLQNTYLLFQVNKYDYSLKKQLQNQKKTYFVDNALITKLGFLFSENRGRLLENLIFIELKRRKKEIFYHNESKECDFVIRKGNTITEAYQVSYAMEDSKTEKREIEGLLDALEVYQLEEGFIITNSMEDTLTRKGKTIRIVPAWKWLLD